MKSKKIDRDKLHRWLRYRADRLGILTVSNTELAEQLGIRADHMGRIMREMERTNRIHRVAVNRHRVATYKVTDPTGWVAPAAGTTAPVAPAKGVQQKRVLKWQ